jgi:hypothetical protein
LIDVYNMQYQVGVAEACEIIPFEPVDYKSGLEKHENIESSKNPYCLGPRQVAAEYSFERVRRIYWVADSGQFEVKCSRGSRNAKDATIWCRPHAGLMDEHCFNNTIT